MAKGCTAAERQPLVADHTKALQGRITMMKEMHMMDMTADRMPPVATATAPVRVTP